MKIKGGIFDVDGTLLDSMSIWDTIGADYLRSIGYVPRENLNEVFKNMSLLQAAEYYRSEYGVALSVEEIMRGVNAKLEALLSMRSSFEARGGGTAGTAAAKQGKVVYCHRHRPVSSGDRFGPAQSVILFWSDLYLQ